MTGVLSWFGRWACVPVQEISVLPWLLYCGPSTKYIFFLTIHYFSLCVPIAQQPGQAVVQGRLPRNVCLRTRPYVAGTNGTPYLPMSHRLIYEYIYS